MLEYLVILGSLIIFKNKGPEWIEVIDVGLCSGAIYRVF
jgi:hypothetical protein